MGVMNSSAAVDKVSVFLRSCSKSCTSNDRPFAASEVPQKTQGTRTGLPLTLDSATSR